MSEFSDALLKEADAWALAQPDDGCRCGAYSSGECGCGLYRSINSLRIDFLLDWIDRMSVGQVQPAPRTVTAEHADAAWKHALDNYPPNQIARAFLSGLDITVEAPRD